MAEQDKPQQGEPAVVDGLCVRITTTQTLSQNEREALEAPIGLYIDRLTAEAYNQKPLLPDYLTVEVCDLAHAEEAQCPESSP